MPGIDIHDWHRGTLDQFGALKLSSRRLLVLIDKLPDEGAYKTSQRGGYLSEAELIPREMYNELANMRASYYAVNGGEASVYEPFQFVDPVIRAEQMLEQAVEDEDSEQANELLLGDMGISVEK